MRTAWDGDDGARWALNEAEHDKSTQHFRAHFIETAQIKPSMRVLDFGCGCGATTREAARRAVDGLVVGADISSPMVDRARELAAAEGLDTIEFRRGDVQTATFEDAAYDVVMSQFGSMFFDDKVEAFSNLRNAARPGARLHLLAWPPRDPTDWTSQLADALAFGRDLSGELPVVGQPGPLGLADVAQSTAWLTDAGWIDVDVESIRLPIVYADIDTAVDHLSNFGRAYDLMQGLDTQQRPLALERLRALITSHATHQGVRIERDVLLYRARRPDVD
jgi:ubiquinone/menaquinone biosynthesis C-methylase UbiE